MRLILCLALAGCGLEARPVHDPITEARLVCFDDEAYWLYITRDGVQQPPVNTGRPCASMLETTPVVEGRRDLPPLGEPARVLPGL